MLGPPAPLGARENEIAFEWMHLLNLDVIGYMGFAVCAGNLRIANIMSWFVYAQMSKKKHLKTFAMCASFQESHMKTSQMKLHTNFKCKCVNKFPLICVLVDGEAFFFLLVDMKPHSLL